MSNRTIFYATNRKHKGLNRWKPLSYGPEFSIDGRENLRFGKLSVNVNEDEINKHLNEKTDLGLGNGENLAKYLSNQVKETARICAFEEKLVTTSTDREQSESAVYGSLSMFNELKQMMEQSRDVLVFIHGFNVSWNEAVGSALALQEMLNRRQKRNNDPVQLSTVVLFSWPSDGKMYPFHSYRSDRQDACSSGFAVGRGLLKLRDFLIGLSKAKADRCEQEIHLLCHSMGNFVLQSALSKLLEFSYRKLNRMFSHIFMCAPDVNDDALERDSRLGRLYELARNITVYLNEGDVALHISDYTKGNTDRLGTTGLAHPSLVHRKIHQVDCSELVTGLIEHSYYLSGKVCDDIRASIENVPQIARPDRDFSPGEQNSWILKGTSQNLFI